MRSTTMTTRLPAVPTAAAAANGTASTSSIGPWIDPEQQHSPKHHPLHAALHTQQHVLTQRSQSEEKSMELTTMMNNNGKIIIQPQLTSATTTTAATPGGASISIYNRSPSHAHQLQQPYQSFSTTAPIVVPSPVAHIRIRPHTSEAGLSSNGGITNGRRRSHNHLQQQQHEILPITPTLPQSARAVSPTPPPSSNSQVPPFLAGTPAPHRIPSHQQELRRMLASQQQAGGGGGQIDMQLSLLSASGTSSSPSASPRKHFSSQHPISSQHDLELFLRSSPQTYSLQDTQVQLRSLVSQLESSYLELSVLRRESNSYKDSHVHQIISECEQAKQRMEAAEKELSVVTKDKLSIQHILTQTQSSLTTLTASHEELTSHHKSLTQEARLLKEEKKRASKEMEQCLRSREDMERREQSMRVQLLQAQDTCRGMKEESMDVIRKLDKEKIERRRDYEKLQSDLATLDTIREENRVLLEEVNQRKNEISALQDELVAEQTSKQDALSRLDISNQLITKLQVSLDQHIVEEATLERTLEESKTSYKDLTIKHSILTTTLRDQQLKHDAHLEDERRRYEALDKMCVRVQKEKSDVKGEMEKLSTEHTALQTTYTSLLTQHTQLQSTLLGFDILRQQQLTQIQDLSSVVMERDTMISQLKVEIRTQVDDLQMTQQNLQEALTSLNSTTVESSKKETDLGSVKQQVEKLKEQVVQQTRELLDLNTSHGEEKKKWQEDRQVQEQQKRETEIRARTREQALIESTLVRQEMEEKLEAVQTELSHLKDTQQSLLDEKDASYTKLEKLYEDTCNEMISYTSLKDQEQHVLNQQIEKLKNDIAGHEELLRKHRIEKETQQLEYERLLISHRTLNTTTQAQLTKIQEIEARWNEERQKNRSMQGALNVANANLVLVQQQKEKELKEVKEAKENNTVTSATSTTTATSSTASVPASTITPTSSTRSINSSPADSKSTQHQNNNKSFPEYSSITDPLSRMLLTELRTQYDDAQDEVVAVRKKCDAAYESCEVWRGKYEEVVKKMGQQQQQQGVKASPRGSTRELPPQSTQSSSNASMKTMETKEEQSPGLDRNNQLASTTLFSPAPSSSSLDLPHQQQLSAARHTLSLIPLAVGLLFTPTSPNESLGLGVTCTNIKPLQSAQSAGLLIGDVIYSINHQPTHSKQHFLKALRGVMAGDKLDVELKRHGVETKLVMEIGGREKSIEEIRKLRAAAGMS